MRVRLRSASYAETGSLQDPRLACSEPVELSENMI